MNAESLKESIRRELPEILRTDPEFRAYLLNLTREEYAGRAETNDRFYELLGELRRDREKNEQKWEENSRQWDEQKQEDKRKWDEQKAEDARKWEENNRKWDENNRKWDEQQREGKRKWDENNLKWAEQNRQWREDQAAAREEFRLVHEEIMAQAKKFDRSIGALGARWGLQSEKAFRDALAGILEVSFGVQVINVNEYDDQGEVFGRPDQVELDVIIQNGLLLICELKSSIDKAGMYSFERKARFYERRHGRTANRLIVISPMIDARAAKVAERLGIETYGDSTDLKAL
ncbi:hypothetical protein CCR95_07285 [Thiocystis minor]|uniref:PD-(D/E)XK nuclease family protein n=1 Tax=Thiocystis minor TaxID=61597 RepID=UPI001914C8DB|nr:DUF3782 domain-containing protein [Thiocystis minor]MBK5963895.1 hypothetical protein [Thiocystis minor]